MVTRAFLIGVVLGFASGCPLPAGVLYKCELNGTCAQPGYACGEDGYCRPACPGGCGPQERCEAGRCVTACDEADGGCTPCLADGGCEDSRTTCVENRCALRPACADGQCADGTLQCRPDGLCYPSSCVPLEATAACAGKLCGFTSDRCGDEIECTSTCVAGLECGVITPNRCDIPRLCSQGWCWENPLPQGATLEAAYRADRRHIWFVGEFATVLFFDGERSHLQSVPFDEAAPPPRLLAVHGTGPNDVYAVGEAGTLFHFDGKAWEREFIDTGPTPSAIRAVWALPEGRAVAVGQNNLALLRTPAATVQRRWSQAAVTGSYNYLALTELSDGGVWALDSSGALVRARADLAAWSLATRVSVGVCHTVTSLTFWNGLVTVGCVPSAGGFPGVQLLNEDGGWGAVPIRTTAVNGLLASGDELWAFGDSIYRFRPDAGADGGIESEEFRLTPLGDAERVWWQAAAALRPGVALLAGGRGELDTLVAETGQLDARFLGTHRGLYGVCGFDDETLVAGTTTPVTVCNGGSTCRPKAVERKVGPVGVSWKEISYPSNDGRTTTLRGCFAEPTSREVWLVGDALPTNGPEPFLHRRGTTWDVVDSINGLYSAAWGRPGGYFFVRRETTDLVTSPDGLSNFSVSPGPDAGRLSGVWGVDDEVLTVGDEGTIARLGDGGWRVLGSGGTTNWAAIHGAATDAGARFVAVGNGGAVWTEDEATQGLGEVRLRQSWVSTSGEAWVVGEADGGMGFVARRRASAQAFERVPLPFRRPLNGIFGVERPDGGRSVWVTGAEGLLLRYDGD